MENIEFGGNKIPMRLVRVGFLNESNLDIGSKEKVPDKVEDFEGRESLNPWKLTTVTNQLYSLEEEARFIHPDSIRNRFSSLTDDLFGIVLELYNSNKDFTHNPGIGHYIYRSWMGLYPESNQTIKELVGESILLENADWIYYVMDENGEYIAEIEDVRPVMTLLNIYIPLIKKLEEHYGRDLFSDIGLERSYPTSEIINKFLLYSQVFLELYVDNFTDVELKIINEFYDPAKDFAVLPDFDQNELTYNIDGKDVPVEQIYNAYARYIGRRYNMETDNELIYLDDYIIHSLKDNVVSTMRSLHHLLEEHLDKDKVLSVKYFEISEILTEYYLREDKYRAFEFLGEEYRKVINNLSDFGHSDSLEEQLYSDVLDYVNYNIITRVILSMDISEDPLNESIDTYQKAMGELKSKFQGISHSDLVNELKLRFEKYLKIYNADVRNTNNLESIFNQLFNT